MDSSPNLLSFLFQLDMLLLPDFCWFCTLYCPSVDSGQGKCLHSWKLANGTEHLIAVIILVSDCPKVCLALKLLPGDNRGSSGV